MQLREGRVLARDTCGKVSSMAASVRVSSIRTRCVYVSGFYTCAQVRSACNVLLSVRVEVLKIMLERSLCPGPNPAQPLLPHATLFPETSRDAREKGRPQERGDRGGLLAPIHSLPWRRHAGGFRQGYRCICVHTYVMLACACLSCALWRDCAP